MRRIEVEHETSGVLRRLIAEAGRSGQSDAPADDVLKVPEDCHLTNDGQGRLERESPVSRTAITSY